MKKSIGASIELSENHHRSISITLQLVDKALCEWDDWTKEKLRIGVMYRQSQLAAEMNEIARLFSQPTSTPLGS